MSATGLPRASTACRKFTMCRRIAGATCFSSSLLGLVLGILLQLVGHVLWIGSPFSGDEVVAHHARLERSLVAVERRGPGYFGSGGWPQVRCCQTTFRSPIVEGRRLRVGDVRLAALSIRMPPVEETRLGQPRPSIQRTMSNMWMPMSPTMPLPYSMNARQRADARASCKGAWARARSTSRNRDCRAARYPADSRGRACGSSSRSPPARPCPACPSLTMLSRASPGAACCAAVCPPAPRARTCAPRPPSPGPRRYRR